MIPVRALVDDVKREPLRQIRDCFDHSMYIFIPYEAAHIKNELAIKFTGLSALDFFSVYTAVDYAYGTGVRKALVH
jgi:hypothetical protein